MNIPRWTKRATTSATTMGQLSDTHRMQVATRKQAAMLHVDSRGAAVGRISTAPPAYLLAHNSGDVARHCELLSALPAPGEVRVLATPGRGQFDWHVDVASRDRPGLLAAFTGVLAARYLNVSQAVIATWDDGAALEAFVIKSATSPDAAALQVACEASLSEALSSAPLLDAQVTFDHCASPLYSRCDVRATDRVGLLHSIAVALSAAGSDVHAASVSTADGFALDRFDLSHSGGRKLGPADEELITTTIRNGVAPSARKSGLTRRAHKRAQLV
jgi:[protein-PII] uridylyltransferase